MSVTWSASGGFSSDSLIQMEASNFAPDLPKSAQLLAVGKVWCVEPSFQAHALEILDGLTISEAIEAQSAFIKNQKEETEGKDAKPYEMAGKTAIIRVSGPMTKKPTSASYLFGGTSTLMTAARLRAAKKDPDVDSILMTFETPGGEAAGCSELADEVRAVNSVKPVVGFIDDMCASAGMFPASQCSALYMNKMGQVGCVGTLAVVQDQSAAAAMAGVKVLVYKSEGATYKGMLTPGTTLTPEQSAHLQEIVDHYGNEFKATVQMGRGLSDEAMKSVITAKMFTATEAMKLGLIDGVASFEQTLSYLTAGTANSTLGYTAPDPATASNSRGQGTQMTIKDILARLGVQPQALTAAGIDPSTLEAVESPPNVSSDLAEVKGELARLQNAALSQQAENFWQKLITPDPDGRAFATWAEKEGIIATYKTLALLDGGGKLQYDNAGQPVIGASLKAFMDSNLNRAKNSLQKELIPGADPTSMSGQGLNTPLMTAAVKRMKNSGRLDAKTADKVAEGIK